MVMREFLNRCKFQRTLDTTNEETRGPDTVGEGCTAAGRYPYAKDDRTCLPYKEVDRDRIAKGCTRRRWTLTWTGDQGRADNKRQCPTNICIIAASTRRQFLKTVAFATRTPEHAPSEIMMEDRYHLLPHLAMRRLQRHLDALHNLIFKCIVRPPPR